jgi:hypothetical protein
MGISLKAKMDKIKRKTERDTVFVHPAECKQAFRR